MLRPTLLFTVLLAAPSACAIDFSGYHLREGEGGGDSTPPTDPWVRVEVGGSHTCALTKSNKLYCWGQPDFGKLGHGTQDEVSGPTVVHEPQPACGAQTFTGFELIALGRNHTCATASSALYCWGNTDGLDIQSAQENLPTLINADCNTVVGLAAGSMGTCVARHPSDSPLRCWNIEPALEEPSGIMGTIDHVAVGQDHACAATTDGNGMRVYCWGSNSHGQVDETPEANLAPTRLVDTFGGAGTIVGAEAGMHHTCILKDDELWCWGDNSSGQIMDGSDRLTPVRVATEVRQFALGDAHTCFAREDGSVQCRGSNSVGQLGVKNMGPTTSTVDVPNLANVIQLSAHGNHTCALTKGIDYNRLYCWGANDSHQIPSSNASTETPTEIAAP